MQFNLSPVPVLAALLLAGPLAAQAQALLPPGKEVPPAGPVRKKYMFAQKQPDCPVVANVTKNTDEDSEANGTYTRVCYRSQPELLVEINELRKLHNWADSTYQRRLAALPPGGLLVVTLRRQGPKGADPAYLFFSAKDKAGQPVFSYHPQPGFGRFHSRDQYQNVQQIPFPQLDPAAYPLTLTINDTRLRQLFEYTLEASK